MIPNSFGTVIAFLLFIAPGAIWQWWRSRYRSSAKETFLTETARAALISIAASMAAALLTAQWTWIPIFKRNPVGSSAIDTASMNFTLDVLIAILINAAIACALTWIVALICWHGPPTVTSMNVWTRTFSSFGSRPYLIVELTDGTAWKGYYVSHDLDIDSSTKNLAIGRPLLAKNSASGGFKANDNASLVILKEDSIKTIQAIFIKKSDEKMVKENLSLVRRFLRCLRGAESGLADSPTGVTATD